MADARRAKYSAPPNASMVANRRPAYAVVSRVRVLYIGPGRRAAQALIM